MAVIVQRGIHMRKVVARGRWEIVVRRSMVMGRDQNEEVRGGLNCH